MLLCFIDLTENKEKCRVNGPIDFNGMFLKANVLSWRKLASILLALVCGYHSVD